MAPEDRWLNCETITLGGVSWPGACVDAVVKALRASKADTGVPDKGVLCAYAWYASPGTGACDYTEIKVRLSVAPGGNVLVELRREAGCTMTFWRTLRAALAYLREDAATGIASFGSVASGRKWGVDCVRRDAAMAWAGPVEAADVRPLGEMLRSEFDDVRTEGAKMTASVSASVRSSEAGVRAVVEAGIVGELGRLLERGSSVVARVAAATAVAELTSEGAGQRALTGCAALVAVREALREIRDMPVDIREAHLWRETTRALGNISKITLSA